MSQCLRNFESDFNEDLRHDDINTKKPLSYYTYINIWLTSSNKKTNYNTSDQLIFKHMLPEISAKYNRDRV